MLEGVSPGFGCDRKHQQRLRAGAGWELIFIAIDNW